MTGLSSLPLGQEEGHDGQTQKFKGVARILGPRWAHLPTITIGLLGDQIFWSVEMSYASPYLLSLGLSKASMAIVFVAGPLSGLIMQPLIGALADNSTSRFGRRRPYMLSGTLVCVMAMLLLGFTRPVASLFTSWYSSANNVLTISLAVLSIYLIDFSINAVQAVDRALLVDTLPPSRQASGNAWAARMLGVGSVVGFFIGNIDLPRMLPLLGKTQLEVLSVIVSLLLLFGHLVMAMLIKERVLCTKSQGKSFLQEVKDIWSNMKTLPHVIRQICFIQFFAWIAWFPILFYTTIYIGDHYKRGAPVATTDEQQLLLDAEATRLGSRALFFSSVLSLLVNVILPAFVSESATQPTHPVSESWWDRICRVPKSLQIHMATLWAVSHFVLAGCMFATFFTHSVWGSTLIITVTGFSWAVTQWAPFSLLAEAILTERTPQEEPVAIRLADARSPRPQTLEDQEREFLVSGRDSDEEGDDDDDERAKRQETNPILTHAGARVSRIEVDEVDGYEVVHHDNVRGSREGMGSFAASSRHEHGGGSLSSKAGIILGIHNIFIVIPQFLVTGFAALLFAIVDPETPALPGHHAPVAPHPGPATNVTLGLSKNITDSAIRVSTHMLRSTDVGDANSVVYIFRVGGVAASFAFVLCWRLARELRHR